MMEKVRLGDAFTIIRNGASIKQEKGASGIPITRIETISDRTINRDKLGYANIFNIEKYYDYILQDDDILMSHINSERHLGKVAIYKKINDEIIIHGMNLLMLRADKRLIDASYAMYYFNTPSFLQQIISITKKSVNQASFTVTALKEVHIPLPTMNEQRNIAHILDKLTDLINKRKQQLQKLDELVKARFVEMFGDCDLSIGDKSWQRISCIGKVVGGATPKTNISEYWDGKYRWITPAELDADSGYIYDSERKLTKLGVDSCSLQELPVDTVILTSRAPIGKLAITGDTFYCNQGFKNIICGDKVLPMYLYYILLFNVDYLNSLGRGATFKEISKSIVENIKIPVPSIDRQNHFVTFIKQINKTKLTIQKSLDKLELLKKALMQEYFG